MEQVNKLLSNCMLAGPADESMISEAEAKLDARFPPSYRRFLAEYGAAVCEGFEIAGVFSSSGVDQPPLWSHVVSKTLQMRRAARGHLPHGYIAISHDGGDHTFYLDTAQVDASAECPVVALGPGAEGTPIAKNFLDFLARAASGIVGE